MSSYMRIIYDRLDFIEFKQNILFLKPPQHKAEVFNKLTIDEFLKIREFSRQVEDRLNNNELYTFSNFENELFDIWSPIRSYPSGSNLIAKALMSKDNYDKLFKHNN